MDIKHVVAVALCSGEAVAAVSESPEGRLLRANLRPHPRALIDFHHCLSRLEVSPATPTTPFLLSSRPQQALLLLGVVPTSFIITSSPARPPPHGFSLFSQRQFSTSTALQLNAAQHPTTSVPSLAHATTCPPPSTTCSSHITPHHHPPFHRLLTHERNSLCRAGAPKSSRSRSELTAPSEREEREPQITFLRIKNRRGKYVARSKWPGGIQESRWRLIFMQGEP